MKRFVLDKLIKWKNSINRKPLILKGVRQCGKTYILKEFGNLKYENVAYFNFEQNKLLSKIFETDFDVDRIILELTAISNIKIEKNSTLIIFDEIQECSNALTSLKYFCENGKDYHVACAGSLLGIALHSNVSFPVGKVDFINLYPMSFSEFLIATNNEGLFEYLKSFKSNTIPEIIAAKLEELLKQYLVIGGMPEVVNSWITSNDFELVNKIQQDIIYSYELDFAKHADIKEFPKLTAIWTSIPNQLAKPNKKFIFSQVKKGYRAKDLEDSLEWLIDAGLIFKVPLVEKPNIPLSSYADNSYFKIYLCDVGLMRKMANISEDVIFNLTNIYSEFKGALAENFVLNELIKMFEQKIYYWNSGNEAEVDFLIQIKASIIPIEVKSEKNVRAKSLGLYINKYNPKYALKVSLLNNVGGNNVYNLPLYYLSKINDLE